MLQNNREGKLYLSICVSKSQTEGKKHGRAIIRKTRQSQRQQHLQQISLKPGPAS